MISQTAKSPIVALLIAGGPLGYCVANRLAERFKNLTVIQEEPERKWDIVRRRARFLGWGAAIGQAAFGVVYKLGESKHKLRRQRVLSDAGLLPTLRPDLNVQHVSSVNGPDCQALLTSLKPDVVAVYGTRLIKPKLMEKVAAPFINYHAGITPKYRGQHPAYWALAAADRSRAGVTIHLVDDGVDTGKVLAQRTVRFSEQDTIWTYQWVQLAEALPLLEDAIDNWAAAHETVTETDVSSQLYFPPTIWTYVRNGLRSGVW